MVVYLFLGKPSLDLVLGLGLLLLTLVAIVFLQCNRHQ